jgi:histone H3/H4
MAELLVVRSKLKDLVKGMNVSGDFADALSKEVEVLVQSAAKRAEANGRRTVQSRDL